MAAIQPGKYRHYKGNFYEVIGTVRHSETLEEMVLYRPLYAKVDSATATASALWVRPRKMFEEEIFVDGRKMLRFEFVG